MNSAGLLLIEPKPFFEISSQEWDRLMAVNLKGVFLCCKAVFPFMRDNNHGKIVNVASNSAYSGGSGRLHYVSSKACVIGLTRALAKELGCYQICVNALAPRLTRSERFKLNESSFTKRVSERSIKRDELPEDLIGVRISETR